MIHAFRTFQLLPLVLPSVLAAQIPIADARELPIGTVVSVSGVVTSGNEFGSIRYLQDATAGIAVFPGTGSAPGFSPSPGTSITVTGPLKLFNGLLEIDPVQGFSINSVGGPLPEPITITPAMVNEAFESRLVRISAATFNDAGGTFTSTTWPFQSGGETSVVYVRSSNPLLGTAIPFGAVDIIGIVSQFTSSTPPVGGYQLLPRGPQDLLNASGIHFTSAVQQQDILPAAFTLTWTTDVPGSAGVRYGPTEALGQEVIADGMNELVTLEVPGLMPANFYYAVAWSALDGDTVFSQPGLYSTASSIPGEILVYFNKPVDHAVATGSLAIDLGSAIDDTIRAYMDRAMHTIDIAIYNTSNNSMVHALNDAVSRGVQVRFIAEGSTSNSSLATLPQFPVFFVENSSGSGMHNKFLAIDADDPQRAVLLTGSMNFTNTSFFFDANNLVVMKDQAITRTYRTEFEEMWGSQGAQPDPVNSRTGGAKLDNTPHLFNIGGVLVECYFSPSDGTQARIDDALRKAQERIRFALFAFTSGTLANALTEMHQAGIHVAGLLDDAEAGSTIMQQLLAAGISVGTDAVDGSQLHHKYALVDPGMAEADPMVITGSHNWSFNADNHNDENTLIIHDHDLAQQYLQEWEGRNILEVDVAGIAGNGDLLLWPNPSAGIIHIGPFRRQEQLIAMIYDQSGRQVWEEKVMAHGILLLDNIGLSPGKYTLKLIGSDTVRHFPFIHE